MKKLTGYDPASPGPGWVIASGEEAIIEFNRILAQPESNLLESGRHLEQDYRDADTGIRVRRGYLLE